MQPITAIVLLVTVALLSITVITILHPGDNTAVIVSIFGCITPTIPALLALFKGIDNNKAIEQLHLVVNSRLTQLLESTANEAKFKERDAQQQRLIE